MAKNDVRTPSGGTAGSVDLDDAVFGIEPNVPVMHQVVTAQLAARRAGTHSTKTRAERRGGGAKPWRQKGTGRARHGSIRSPQWRGGGIAHGPKPRDYTQRTPKKMVKLALRSALSDRAADGKVLVVDSFDFDLASRNVDLVVRDNCHSRLIVGVANGAQRFVLVRLPAHQQRTVVIPLTRLVHIARRDFNLNWSHSSDSESTDSMPS